MKFEPNLAGKHYGNCPLCHNNSDAKGQRLRSHEAEGRVGGLAEPSFSTPLGRVSFSSFKL